MDLTFLDKINIEEEEKGKEEVVKSIRFSKEEFYMLKYCKFINKKFSTFVKDLINENILELQNEGKIENNLDIDLDVIKEQLKIEIKDEILKELNTNNKSEISVEKDIDNDKLDAKKDVLNFINGK
ncbi:hypothetical protein [Clostridium baratii]|uniref:hypothetical protein n=1 Tax=Clostridium baratii TaxID=1561 RepID=UPI0030D1047D